MFKNIVFLIQFWRVFKVSKLIVNFLIIFTLFPQIACAQKKSDCQPRGIGQLGYQPRQDRCEGVKKFSVAGKEIELLSALAYYGERWETIPEFCKLKFYLPEQKAVDLKTVKFTVRELTPKLFYWMENIPEQTKWQKIDDGYHYQWSTESVIKPLKLDISTLGVLVHLEKQGLDNIEKVAPVTFYHTEPPEEIKGYLFDFKVGGDAKLKYSLYKDKEKLKNEDLGEQVVGNPFRIFWESSKAEEGEYKLVISGYFLNDFTPIHHVIQFYHKKK